MRSSPNGVPAVNVRSVVASCASRSGSGSVRSSFSDETSCSVPNSSSSGFEASVTPSV